MLLFYIGQFTQNDSWLWLTNKQSRGIAHLDLHNTGVNNVYGGGWYQWVWTITMVTKKALLSALKCVSPFVHMQWTGGNIGRYLNYLLGCVGPMYGSVLSSHGQVVATVIAICHLIVSTVCTCVCACVCTLYTTEAVGLGLVVCTVKTAKSKGQERT